MDAVQPRLFPAPKPLVERLGVEFFRRVPEAPGVYLMAGELERLLYVGQARNLRARLNSYRHVLPERASRKVVRLIHEVRSVTWEVCSSPNAAVLRENELLRLLKPRFNVMNVRPEHYRFLGVRVADREIQLRLTRQPLARPGETLHGAFKALGRVRAGFVALLRLLWAAEHQPESIGHFPRRLIAGGGPDAFSLPLARSEADPLAGQLRRMLDGHDDELLQHLAAAAPAIGGAAPCRQRLHEMDFEALQRFHQFGPARNRSLRAHWGCEGEVLAPEELDDLLVMLPKPPRPAVTAPAAGGGPGLIPGPGNGASA